MRTGRFGDRRVGTRVPRARIRSISMCTRGRVGDKEMLARGQGDIQVRRRRRQNRPSLHCAARDPVPSLDGAG
jgi:hypothetical protein